MKLDFIICGSPNDEFCSQIAFFRLCLDALGGDYANARLVAVFGDEDESNIPARWNAYFSNIESYWVSAAEFNSMSYNAQHYARFEHIRDEADLVVMCDADVAIFNSFEALAQELLDEPCLAGTLAHYPPWHDQDNLSARGWDEFNLRVVGKVLESPHRYSLLPLDQSPNCPFYINYGVFIGTPALLKQFASLEATLRDKAFALGGQWWGPQLNLATTCGYFELPTRVLPVIYNYPNDVLADELYEGQAEQAVFIHYLRTNLYDRHKIFVNQSEFDQFLSLELQGIDQVFQNHVAKLCDSKYPF